MNITSEQLAEIFRIDHGDLMSVTKRRKEAEHK